MLVKMNSDSMFRVWQDIRPRILEAYPPFAKPSEASLTSILRSIISENMDCWIILNKDKKVIGLLTTTIQEDMCSGTKSLLIYTLQSDGGLTKDIWFDGLETIKKFARSKGCTKITGYTNVESIREMFRRLGGQAEMTYLELEV